MNTMKTTLIGAAMFAGLAMASQTLPAAAGSAGQGTLATVGQARTQVSINHQTNQIGRATLKQQIGSQTRSMGVKLSPAELEGAVKSAMNKLAAPGQGPQKGIIHLKFKRFTICIAWGRDKGHCS